ncbi:class I SAM-dependent methyltransferase [Falsiroseomonas selenitidurans]|uniref:Class I SAM-dependent methyltransferase n=1 Tax=Falsiroseomonas selenitidurans TaxID=2716335 RepID=A0ABX1DZE9_9PROT|nr:class I SAM-dependent methyltransferase [Falsiroseomonas selenitidurans]NKC30243.1 class I SAM-dependent methyltransferase [Falsiroseomonas selenitidurans]
MDFQAEDLIEAGRRVTVDFRGREVAARADRESGYVFFDPPSPAELDDYYQNTYQKSSTEYYTVETDYAPDKNRYHADRILEACRAWAGRLPASSLELGCAYGGLVQTMADRGIDAQGTDINGGAVAEGQRVKGNRRIRQADNLTALAAPAAPVELIYSLHVLEHDPNLFEVLRLARRALSPEGLLFIGVPNAMYLGGLLRGFRRNPWVNYPQHLHMLSAGMIPALCRQADLVPLAWNTGLLFETDASAAQMLSAEALAEGVPDALALLAGQSGFGMELNMLLAPARGRLAAAHAAEVALQLNALEAQRRREVAIRAARRRAPGAA